MAEEDGPYDYSRIEGMDPAANWLLGMALDDYLPDHETMPIPFLIEFGDETAAAEFSKPRPMNEGNTGNGTLVVAFDESDPVKVGEIVAAFASLKWFQRLLDGSDQSEPLRVANKRIVLSSPIPLPENLLVLFPDFPSFPRLQ